MAHRVPRKLSGKRKPALPAKTVKKKEILGAVIALILGGIWVSYEIRGEEPPPALAQGIVAAAALMSAGAIKQ